MSLRRSKRTPKPTVKTEELSPKNESSFSTPPKKRIKKKENTPAIIPLRSNRRARQEKNYKEESFADSLFGDDDSFNDKDYVVKTEPESDSESSGSEFFSKKKPKLSNSYTKEKSLINVLETIDPTDEENEYRLQRQKNIRDRFKVLDSLDFDSEKKLLKSAAKVTPKPKTERKKPVKTPQPTEPVKRSLRLQNRSLNLSLDGRTKEPELQFGSLVLKKEEYEYKRIIDEEVPFIKEGAEENMIAALKELKNDINLPYDETIGYSSGDFDKYYAVVRSCVMRQEASKIIQNRIASMDFHPSDKKLIVLAGDKSGNIALQDIVKYDIGIQFKAHSRNVNCATFSTQDHTKFFSTSLDGIVRQGDINSSKSTLIYEADECQHTTWHHEFGHSLFVAEGDGVVKIVDMRMPGNESDSFKCHPRSVRTVQLHPTNDNYFLTSSGYGQFGIFDLRTARSDEPNPVILQEFDKALTSAFLSDKGNYVVSTSNDDTIRVFDVSDQQTSTQITKLKHNNHTGRWLSVFKAKWHPGREDAFLVGSMMNDPKRFQLYHRNGEMLHNFASEEMMTTFTPVIIAHPSQPVFVGGNGSGKIHVFSPFLLEEIYS